MSEEERPEIPRELVESMPSAGTLEEQMRRGYQIRLEAWERGIPESSLKDATVSRYVSVLRDLSAAFDRPDMRDDDGRARGERRPTGVVSTFRWTSRLA